MTDELVTLLGDEPIGRVRRARRGQLSFVYDDHWRAARNAYPLSLSMPLSAREHSHARIESFLWNLLPDNSLVLERWAKRFHVSARSAFGLIAAVGEDCAGAARFVLPERVRDSNSEGEGVVEWLNESEVAERLRALRQDVSAWRSLADAGQFSLAGAQPKTALLFDGRRWGLPSGRIPTTHILKPGVLDLAGHAENEHFCLALARELGIPAALSQVVRFGSELALVVERYDRVTTASGIRRVHQEDACQALGVPPTNKYENEGGPGARSIISLLREHSRAAADDTGVFMDALIYNWLIGGTDAHAKNYSLLIGAQGKVRLAPLYDVASALPYREMSFQKLKLAMRVGGKYRLCDIGWHEWSKLALELKLEPEQLRAAALRLASELTDRAADLLTRSRDQGLDHPILADLVNGLGRRARDCSTLLNASSARRK